MRLEVEITRRRAMLERNAHCLYRVSDLLNSREFACSQECGRADAVVVFL